jgi:hypothetical protein
MHVLHNLLNVLSEIANKIGLQNLIANNNNNNNNNNITPWL